MAVDLSHDETFFEGINDMNLLTGEDTFINATQPDGKEKKTPRKPKSTATKTKPPQKEKTNLEKTEPKKPTRTSKIKREPLKTLNSTEKPPEDSKPEKKNSMKDNTTNDSTQRGKAVGKIDQSFPKIVVFERGSGTAKVRNNKTPVVRLSKSCDSAAATGRRSLPGGRKTQTAKKAQVRYSVNDFPSEKTPNKTKKSSVTAENKSPAKRVPKLTLNESVAKLKAIFPDADPDFVKSQLVKFKGSMEETAEFLINTGKENEPSIKTDYLRPYETEELEKMFLENFRIEDFLKLFPNPWEHFSKKERQKSPSYVKHSFYYLKNKFRKHFIYTIQEAMAKNQNCLYLADKQLSRKNRLVNMRATSRSKSECDASRPTTFNTDFMQEVAFIENERQIKLHLKKVETARHKKFKEAEKAETLLECLSCNNFSLLQDDTVNCPAHHVFCKDCLIKYLKIEMGNNEFKFKCLVKCEEAFPVETLKNTLSPSIVARIIERNQMEKIKPEGIENLVCCPFCYNIFIESSETMVLKCPNPNCRMESCRKCKKSNHTPWNCKEAKQLMKAPLEVQEEEKMEEIAKQENGESEQEEEEANASDESTSCSGEFLKREVSNETDRDFVATICSVCQQSECSHTDNQPCNRSSQSVSFSSDCTEGAESGDHENSSMEFFF